MASYFFILGRENKISQKELECILASFGFCLNAATTILSEEVLESKLGASGGEIAGLMNILGGTVKIYQKIASGGAKVVELLKKENTSKKIIFGISNYSKNQVDTFRLALEAKKSLRMPLRVVAGKENDRLSSAQSFQYKMDRENIEYGLFDTGVGRLIAVQNINEWTRHDYGKPRSDAKSGMLPPKLARIMVNIALGSAIQTQSSKIKTQNCNSKVKSLDQLEIRNYDDFVVVDPFCGSGNILLEALSIGCEISGSDVSEKAVENTKKNLEWLAQSVIPTPFDKLRAGSVEGSSKRFLDPTQRVPFGARNDKNSVKISREDATKFDFGKIDRDFVIVTEPFLGQPRRAKLRIEAEKQAKEEATKLYLDFLKNLKLTVNSSKLSAICMVFPQYELANGKKLSIFNECVDFIREIGYTLICSPLEYGRDYQVVKREIVLLKFSA